MGFFEKLKEGLAKTKSAFVSQVDNLFKSFVKVDEELFDELEELLICADVGVGATEEILDKLRDRVKSERLTEGEQVKAALREIMADMIGEGEPLKLGTKPSVLLIIGVNGVGKTTSIGKIAAQLKADGKKVVVAAADTFRAAAIDQLAVWCDRAGVDLIKQSEGSDPAAVVYDAVSAAKGRNADVLIVDTAGRLHNKKNLMDELAKMRKVIDREFPEADVRCILVLDATTGQNGLAQARTFKEFAEINGIILTKLDGTAKGGIALSIRQELNVPVWYIGVGEGIDDLQPFDAKSFTKALFGKNEEE